MIRTVLSAAAATTALLASVLTTATAAPERVATYRDWFVFVNDTNEGRVCYAVSDPEESSPRSARHGEVYMMVATWANGAAKEQPSFMAGYQLRDTPEPQLRIGADKWDLFTSANEGFVEAERDEERLVAAMRRGADMRLSAVSERGTATEYTFSLLGISNALDRAARECQ